MSAMANMLADIISKAIPKEVLDALTPDKIEQYKEGVTAFVTNANNKLGAIEAKQDLILQHLEGQKNDGNNNSSE